MTPDEKREYNRLYIQKHKSDPEYKKRKAGYNSKWRAANPLKVQQSRLKYYGVPSKWYTKNKDNPEFKLRQQQYRRNRLKRIANFNAEELKNYKLKRRLIGHIYRERLHKDGNPVYLSYKELTTIFERDKHKCLACGSQERLELDHIIPVSKGGLTTFDNIQLLCKSCNCSKYNKITDYRQ